MENKETLEFYKTADVAKILGCNQATARSVMNCRDFPLIRVGKNYRVEVTAFNEWCRKGNCHG